MSINQRKNPATAPTTTGNKKEISVLNPKSNPTRPAIPMHLPRKIGGSLETWGDCELPAGSKKAVLVKLGDYYDLLNNVRRTQLCPTCVDAAIAHAEEEKSRQEEQRRIQEANLGSIRDDEQLYELIDAHRAGDSVAVKRMLDELVDEDNAALARCGISSWDEGDDDE